MVLFATIAFRGLVVRLGPVDLRGRAWENRARKSLVERDQER